MGSVGWGWEVGVARMCGKAAQDALKAGGRGCTSPDWTEPNAEERAGSGKVLVRCAGVARIGTEKCSEGGWWVEVQVRARSPL